MILELLRAVFVQRKAVVCHRIIADIDSKRMAKNQGGIKKKLLRAGGWQIAKRIAKSIPLGGTAVAVVLVGSDIRNKGVVKGLVNSGIDAIPFVGLGKNAIELFRGDFIPDKAGRG